MNNPLLIDNSLPQFSKIQIEHIESAIDVSLSKCRQAIDVALNSEGDASWDSLVAPIQAADDDLNNIWSPISHLNAVVNTDELRKTYTAALEKLTAYGTEVGQNVELYQAYKQLAEAEEFSALNQAQRKAIENELRDFTLSGVSLVEAKKKDFGLIKQRLSELTTAFANNVLDATQAWTKHITDRDNLAGIPDNTLAMFEQMAKQKDLKGYVIGLDVPSYLAVMMYADDRLLRQEVYRAYSTRASANSESSKDKDNTALIEEILLLRQQQAQLLNFNNYAELSLAKKMAKSTQEVEQFLIELTEKSKSAAKNELIEIHEFAKSRGFTESLEVWDVSYFSEKLKQQKFSISDEELRPYFPADKVVSGLFTIVKKLFGIDVAQASAEVWHTDVKFFNIEKDNKVIASFYLDMFARENKRGGAWMADCRVRYQNSKQQLQLPVAFLVCNFAPAVGDQPALLNHREVVTLFHEFGHGLHHMLTKIDVAGVSGINGVAWDAVELPSQFLENWCWDKNALKIISGHFETNEPLPESLLNNLLSAKNFQSAMQMLRQIEFSLFDLRLHKNENGTVTESVQSVLDSVRREVSVMPPPDFNKFQNSFTHVFAGGYAAGYFSYKWAEVLSSDAFSKFEEEGIFNEQTGREFLETILQCGGSEDAMTLFKKFRGRKPSIEPLLRHSGIV